MNEMKLIRRAILLFPRTEYTDPQQVRHVRRQWLHKVAWLRSASARGWVMDNKVGRMQ